MTRICKPRSKYPTSCPTLLKFPPFSLVIFPHYRCFFPIPFPHSNNGEKLPVLTISPLFSPILGMEKWEKLFSPLFFPILGQLYTTIFPIFLSFLVISFPIRRSAAIRFRHPDRTSNRRSPRRTENRRSRGAKTRLL